MKTFTLNSCIRGYHIYKDVWMPSVRETVNCEHEGWNPEDPYVVALQKHGTITVGHVPCTIFAAYSPTIAHSLAFINFEVFASTPLGHHFF